MIDDVEKRDLTDFDNAPDFEGEAADEKLTESDSETVSCTPEGNDSGEQENAPESAEDESEGNEGNSGETQTPETRDSQPNYQQLAHDYATRLHEALVKLDGRLADPTDLAYSDEHLENPQALTEAITELIHRKPGLRSKQYTNDVGAGQRGAKPSTKLDLVDIIRNSR